MGEPELMKPDIEGRLRVYLPLLFKLLGDSNLSQRQWNKINKKFAIDAYSRRQQFSANNNYLKVEASLYHIISSVIQQDTSAYTKYDFINTVLLRLIKNLPIEQRGLIRETIYQMLVSFDKDYRNFFGELTVLNQLLEDKYSILGIEKDIIYGGKTADFTVEKNGEVILVEVVSIHFYEPMDNLVEFINGKIIDKINKKINDGAIHNGFQLVPVLWAFPNELFKYYQLYKAGKVQLPDNVHEPLAYLSFYEEEFGLIHRFTKISALFTSENIEIIKP